MPSQAPKSRASSLSRTRKRGPDPRDIEVGRRVRAFRLERNLSQTAFANQLGLSFQQVQKYEKGTNRIGAGRLQTIAEIFKIPISELFSTSPSTPQRQESLYELIDSAAALRLLRAYARISNSKAKQALVQMAIAMADD